MISWSALLVLLPLVSSLPFDRRSSGIPYCGQYETIPVSPSNGKYSILTNHWGQDGASGSQCTTLKSFDDDSVEWSTQWRWSGNNNVKSYSNVQLNEGINQQLSSIKSIDTLWTWSQDSSEESLSDIAYDLFTSYSPGGSKVNEVMVWLGNVGDVNAISYEYSYDGKALPIEENIKINDFRWDLYMGSNGYNTVYSFLPTSGNINHFKGDIYKFFTYLMDSKYVDSSEYLISAQGGTEATTGSATLNTSAYNITIESQ